MEDVKSLLELTKKLVELYPIYPFQDFLKYLESAEKSKKQEKLIKEVKKELELHLEFGSNPQEQWIINDESIVGRFDPEVGPIDIDLSYIKGAETVSRKHARLFYQEGSWFLEDLNSTNGTSLNGNIVTGTIPIQSGDVIEFGKVRCQVEVREASKWHEEKQ